MKDKNNPSSAADTGHVWDDNLRELTNQPPRWWMMSLYLSGVFLLVYFVLFPAFPLLHGFTKGVLGWTQMKRYNDSLAEIQAVRAPFESRLQTMDAAAILADQQLRDYAVQSAKVMFSDRCAPCHGAGGAGNPGFPVLADDDWLYGGDIATLVQTISEGRAGMMPAYGGMLNDQQIDDLAKQVLALSKGAEHGPGKALFEAQGCGGCHGADGKGMTMMGSANLTDVVWRFAPGDEEGARHTIRDGVNVPGSATTRQATMPSFKQQLSAAEINKLAVYVHQFGGGK